LLVEAQRMFAKTPSLDDIVDRAYELLNDSVGFFLAAPALTNAKSSGRV
jgi:stearoyl-CoA desaturase (Delta-9 desaturase)